MNYIEIINQIYRHIENDHVDKAVMACLRIARNLNDYFFTAVFLREFYPERREFISILEDDISHLKLEEKQFIDKTSLEYWLDSHTLKFSLGTNDEGLEKNVLAIGVGEIKSDIEQWERSIKDLTLPTGMGEFDTAAFTDRYNEKKGWMRLRIRAAQTIKERIKTRCLNYAIKIEKQIESQNKSEGFVQESYNDVNNYFKAHCEDVYNKLQKAAQFIKSNDPEDHSIILTQIRRAIKSTADFFYPPKAEAVKCADGKERILDDEQYLNRLHEFLMCTFKKSSSRDLLRAEFEHLAAFVRRLNEVASKGVHSDVTTQDAKQGLVCLYMFLYSIIIKIQHDDS